MMNPVNACETPKTAALRVFGSAALAFALLLGAAVLSSAGAAESDFGDGRSGDRPSPRPDSAQVRQPMPARPGPGATPGDDAARMVLALGRSGHLGKAPRPGETAPDYRDARGGMACVEKRHAGAVFCVEPVEWPGEVAHLFAVYTFMYEGTNAIVRYDGGEATYFHALFPSDSFEAVRAYFESRLGRPASAATSRIRVALSSPSRPNPTLVWRSVDPASGLSAILEVRRFDDTRGGFPDMDHGVVLLYREGTAPVFRVLTNADLMLLWPGWDPLRDS